MEKLLNDIANLICDAENRNEVEKGLCYYVSPDNTIITRDGKWQGNFWERVVPEMNGEVIWEERLN